MKTILQLLVLAVSITVANAQDEIAASAPADSAAMTLVYETPVVYNAPVIYDAPVVYNAPVYYGAAAPSCAPAETCYKQDCAPVSTVVYIGGHR